MISTCSGIQSSQRVRKVTVQLKPHTTTGIAPPSRKLLIYSATYLVPMSLNTRKSLQCACSVGFYSLKSSQSFARHTSLLVQGYEKGPILERAHESVSLQ